MQRKCAIVVGGGLAGLTAAYRFHQAGWDVKVLEKSTRVGGRVVSIEKNGYVLDTCAAAITESYVNYLALLKELGLDGRQVDASNIFGVVRNGKAHYVDALMPMRSFLATKLMSWPEKVRFVMGAVKLYKYMAGVTLADPAKSVAYDQLSMHDVARRCFGDALIDTLLDPIIRVVTWGDVKNTTAVELFTGLVSASGRYVSITGGLEMLPRTLASRLDVRLDSPVSSVENRGGKAEINYTDASGVPQKEIADACLITCTFPEAVAMCPHLGNEGSALATYAEFASAYAVHLGYSVLTHEKPAAIALPRREFPNNPALLIEHSKAPDRAPPGHSLIGVYYGPEAVPMLKRWGDDKTIEDARRIAEGFFPELRGHLHMTNVKFAPYGSHLAPPGYFTALREFQARHADSDPIQVAGDYFSIPSQESAVGWGSRMARRIIETQTS